MNPSAASAPFACWAAHAAKRDRTHRSNSRSKSVEANPIAARYASIGVLLTSSRSETRTFFMASMPPRAAKKSNARWPMIVWRRVESADPSRGNLPSVGNVFARSKSRTIRRSLSAHVPRSSSANPSWSQPGKSRRADGGTMSNAKTCISSCAKSPSVCAAGSSRARRRCSRFPGNVREAMARFRSARVLNTTMRGRNDNS